MFESADSEQESADSITDSNADPPKIGIWVWPLKKPLLGVINGDLLYEKP